MIPVGIQDREEYATYLGKSYFFAASSASLAVASFIDLMLTGDSDEGMFVRSLILQTTTQQCTWQLYAGTDFTGGTDLAFRSRNPGEKSWQLPGVAVQDPTINTLGTGLFPTPRTVLGQSAPGNNSYIYQELLTGGYIIPKGVTAHVRITNTVGTTAPTNVLVSVRDMSL